MGNQFWILRLLVLFLSRFSRPDLGCLNVIIDRLGMVKFVCRSDLNECYHCCKLFDSRLDLKARFKMHRVHIEDAHPTIFQCKYVACSYQTDRQQYMRRHQLTVHEKNPVACSIIGCDFVVNYTYMKRHVKECHPTEINKKVAVIKQENSVETSDGDEQSTSNEYEPINDQPTTNQLSCSSCSKKFWTRYLLNKHVARVHEKRYKETIREKSYKCTFEGCNKAYTTPGRLKDHETSHTGELPLECGRCDKKFSGRGLFAKHLRQYHAISIKDVEKMLCI
ncbi:putative zinc finger protein F56D1.1 [Aphelenchoides bicaudatus]|nr:putative zinc finger protein F56D1.1 [Aphelenchoides bicaudatus]